jgi:ABC-type glycerol-3-phosphate transport system substrate-binding protein
VRYYLRVRSALVLVVGFIGLWLVIAPTAPVHAIRQDGATPAPTRDANIILIWWPAPLYPQEKSPAFRLLRDQLDGYQSARAQSATIRVKRADGVGGIFQTLRSGSIAASLSMPDLTLMRRSDLVQASASKLIQPIDMRSLTSEDFFPSGLTLGQINGVQYGVPFALELQHTIYRNATLTSPPQTLKDILQTGQPYLFPASATRGVNSTLLAQYIAAGGHVVNDKGAPVLERDPLLEVLQFYQQGVGIQIVGPQLLEYSELAHYWPLVIGNKANIANIDSTTFLAQRAKLPDLVPIPIPLPNSAALTPLDGWMWVLTTANPERQSRALDLMAWLLRTDVQAQFTLEMGVLPSQRSALQAWNNDAYAPFARTLLQQPIVPPPDTVPLSVSSALQKAFEGVLSGRQTAEAAADQAVSQLGP